MFPRKRLAALSAAILASTALISCALWVGVTIQEGCNTSTGQTETMAVVSDVVVSDDVTSSETIASGELASAAQASGSQEGETLSSGQPTSSSSQGDAAAGEDSYAAGELLVTYDAGLSEEDFQSLLASRGVEVESVELVSSAEEGECLALLRYAGDVSPEQLGSQLSAAEGILSSEPNYEYELTSEEGDGATAEDASAQYLGEDGSSSLTNDPEESSQWEHAAIGLEGAWETVKAEGDVTVAVIDSGVDVDHPDLADNLILDYAKNTFTEQTGADAVDDTNGHGTHVAGTIAGIADNNVGIAGISYNAKILPVKATNEKGTKLYTSDLIEALDYIVELKTSESSPSELGNIRVINMSLGETSYSEKFEEAVQRAIDAGILVVAACGNLKSGESSKSYYPAAYEEVVGVAGLKEDATSLAGVSVDSSYSNYGSFVDVSAPGTKLYSAAVGGSYAYKSGTSMASAVTSAVACLAYAADMDASPSEVEDALEDAALDLGDEGYDEVYGFGCVQADGAVLLLADTKDSDPTQKNGWYDADDKLADAATGSCWYDEGIRAVSKEFYDPASGEWYYAKADGSIAQNELVELGDGRVVCYGVNRAMVRGAEYCSSSGEWYWCAYGDGAIAYGVALIPTSGGASKWVYYDINTGIMAHGEAFLSYDSEHTGWYWFDQATGEMAHGMTAVPTSEGGGKWVYYDINTGIMAHGEAFLSYDSEHTGWYYLDDVTGAVTYGWKALASKTVYYHPQTGQMLHGTHIIDGVVRHFDDLTGALLE